MAINFPDSPNVNDTYTVDDKTFIWTGDYWRVLNSPNYISTLIKDADNDTKIEVEQSADEDIVRITTAGTQRYSIGADGHIIPTANETYDLGSSTNRFRDLYLSGSSIDLGGVAITSDGTSLSMPPISSVSGDFTVDTDTLHVDSANDRVGIGTTSPTTALEISQVNPTLTINDTDGVAGGSIISRIQFEASNTVAGEVGLATGAGNMFSWAVDGNYYAGTRSADNVFFRTADTDRVTIDASGNVGIGTTSPDQKVHIVQDGGNLSSGDVSGETKGTIHLQNSGGTKGAGELSVGVSFSGTDTGRRRGLIAAYQDGTDGDPHGLQFFTYGNTTAGSDAVASRMTIDSSGNVGIGTTSPSQALDVTGNITLTGDIDVLGGAIDLKGSDASYPNSVNFYANDGSGAFWHMSAPRQATSDDFKLYWYNGSSYGERFKLTTTGDTTISGTLTVTGNQITMNGSNSRDKYRVWDSSYYTIGMESAHNFGALADYAMTFQMNSDANRGWWWGDDSHTKSQGAMSLTTIGQLTVADSIRVGFGESDTSAPATDLDVGAGGINSDGRLLVSSYGSFVRAGGSGNSLVVQNSSPVGAGVVRGIQVELGPDGNEDYTDSGDDFIRFITSNNQEIGGIRGTGGASVSYGTSSDYRLKAPIEEISDGLSIVRNIVPMYGKWLNQNDPDRIYSYFIAHELQEHVPDAVSGSKDEVDENGDPEYQSVDYGKLTPVLTAAIKDLDALVQTLTARIEALEAN